MTTAPPLPDLAPQPPSLSRLHEWVVTVDHKRLGIMYITTGLIFFMIGGLEAATGLIPGRGTPLQAGKGTPLQAAQQGHDDRPSSERQQAHQIRKMLEIN